MLLSTEEGEQWSHVERYRIELWQELVRDIVAQFDGSPLLLAGEIRERIIEGEHAVGFCPWLPEGSFWEDILSRLVDPRFGFEYLSMGENGYYSITPKGSFFLIFGGMMNKTVMLRRVFQALEPLDYWVSKESLQEIIEQSEGRKFFSFDTAVFNEVMEEFDFCGYVRKIVLGRSELFWISEKGRDKWCLLQGKVHLVRKGDVIPVEWKVSRTPRCLDSIPDSRDILRGVRSDVELPHVPGWR